MRNGIISAKNQNQAKPEMMNVQGRAQNRRLRNSSIFTIFRRRIMGLEF